ncbi:hypothetical protein WNZ15_11240 [Roseibium sp. AS2]|uniref:hypothetical protein n=1 Tax=Roseibium sp. AS2 TaxID=3135781 RepID=UPI0031824CEE
MVLSVKLHGADERMFAEVSRQIEPGHPVVHVAAEHVLPLNGLPVFVLLNEQHFLVREVAQFGDPATREFVITNAVVRTGDQTL